MIAICRSAYFHLNRPGVALLTQIYFDEAGFLANKNPIAQFYLNTTQEALYTLTGGQPWDDPDVLTLGQPLLDEHPDFGGQGLVLQAPPDEPEQEETPPEQPPV